MQPITYKVTTRIKLFFLSFAFLFSLGILLCGWLIYKGNFGFFANLFILLFLIFSLFNFYYDLHYALTAKLIVDEEGIYYQTPVVTRFYYWKSCHGLKFIGKGQPQVITTPLPVSFRNRLHDLFISKSNLIPVNHFLPGEIKREDWKTDPLLCALDSIFGITKD